MGLRDEIALMVQDAFATALDNIPVEATYQYQDGTEVYDPDTGTTTGGTVSVTGVRMMLAGYHSRDIDGDKIRPKDKKALIPSLNLPGVTCAEDHVISLSDGDWIVKAARIDPAGAMWTLQIRK